MRPPSPPPPPPLHQHTPSTTADPCSPPISDPARPTPTARRLTPHHTTPHNTTLKAAFDWLRKRGAAKASDLAESRTANEGLICIVDNGFDAAIVSVRSETDFVARCVAFAGTAAIAAPLHRPRLRAGVWLAPPPPSVVAHPPHPIHPA